MDDKPFVTVKRAGSATINDNDTGGRRLADIGDVDGHVEILRNISVKPESAIKKKGMVARIFEHPIISSVIAGLILSGLGFAASAFIPD